MKNEKLKNLYQSTTPVIYGTAETIYYLHHKIQSDEILKSIYFYFTR